MHSLRRSNCAFHTQSMLSKSENSMKSYQRVLTDPLVSEIMSTWPGAIIKMQDQDHIEIESMYAAADKGGACLDAIGQTDSCLPLFLSFFSGPQAPTSSCVNVWELEQPIGHRRGAHGRPGQAR